MQTTFQWTFRIKEFLGGYATELIVYADTIDEAAAKIEALLLPVLISFKHLDEALDLVQVYEVDSSISEPAQPLTSTAPDRSNEEEE